MKILSIRVLIESKTTPISSLDNSIVLVIKFNCIDGNYLFEHFSLDPRIVTKEGVRAAISNRYALTGHAMSGQRKDLLTEAILILDKEY